MDNREIDRQIAEKWRPVHSYNGYDVSSYGRVRSWKHRSGRRRYPRLMAESMTSRGYLQVHLWVDGKRIVKSINRMVLEAFLSLPPSEKHHAAHLNGNKQDNRLVNLSWQTPQENIHGKWAHGTMPVGIATNSVKLSDRIVSIIRRLSKGGMSNKEISKLFIVHPSTVGRIVKRKTWKHVR